MFKVCYNNNRGYYIMLNDYAFDEDIAQYLDLPLEEYQNILIKYNGYANLDQGGEAYFKNAKDIKRAIEDETLQIHLIMAKLTE